MKNLMSRDEYLQKMDEGFFKDRVAPAIKKGWEAVKSAFKIGMAKIRDFIAIFDNEGKVLPVVSPQAVIDKFSNVEGVDVYAPKAISNTAVQAGGNGCENKAPMIDNKEVYDDDSWDNEEDYKNSNEYQNFLAMPTIIKEHYGCSDEEAQNIVNEMLGESWEGIKGSRIKYASSDDFAGISNIDYNQFETIVSDMVEERVKYGDKKVVDSDGNEFEAARNVLIFGAPGIGKSTIPNAVIKKYNETVAENDPSRMISLISINCALLEEGGLVMPTMPQDAEIEKALRKFSKTFPQANEYLDDLDEEDAEKVANTLKGAQLKVKDAPKSWLPSYQKTGDVNIDALLDSYANGGVYTDKDGVSIKTGCGGIILFDEFLRADRDVFSQLMNFFLERRLYDWNLGSKWAIIACSNRPCDDGQVAKKWKDWKDSPAIVDRVEAMYQLVPEPDQWIKWIRTKKVDELLLEFIFDKEDMSGDEYPRWHSMVKNGAGEAKLDLPIGPRRWESVFKRFKKYESKHGYKDLSEMSESEIEEQLQGMFDTVFIAEIMDWLRDNMDKIDLDGIMDDPTHVYLPQKFTGDQAKAKVLISNLLKEFKKRFKDHPEDCTDEQLANVILWLGINYKGDMYSVVSFMEEIIKDVFKNGTDTCITRFVKTFQMINAAYPPKTLFADIEKAENKAKYPWPKGSKEIVLDLMRKYFPERISGDKINYYDELKLDDDEKQ